MRIPSLRVFISAGAIAALLSLLSVASALAGDNSVPLPTWRAP